MKINDDIEEIFKPFLIPYNPLSKPSPNDQKFSKLRRG